MSWLAFDCEIQKSVGEGGLGWDDTDKLGVACAAVMDVETGRSRLFGDTAKELDRLVAALFSADRVTSFNGWKFDLPLIHKLKRPEWPGAISDPAQVKWIKNSDDLLRRIWIALDLDPDKFNPRTHGGWGLGDVASATLGVGKGGWGGDAPALYQTGQWPKLLDYCLHDVWLTVELAKFIDRYGYVVSDKKGLNLKVPAWTQTN